jgi:Alpha-kinase family
LVETKDRVSIEAKIAHNFEMAFNQKTSLITILSSVHGRLRREERDISKRDLQAALKYGTRQRNFKGRWKVEHDGIIFIVDPGMRKEITAFPSPLSEAPLHFQERANHENAKTIIKHKPELCKSHTVLVVDNSGSMQTHDIWLHRDRQVAAYTVMALEYVAEQLFKQTANDTDVVSLIEFNESARVVFEREPCSWVLYNKLLARRESGTFIARQGIAQREINRPDSNYLPALAMADSLLEVDRHDECALGLFFLSDGKPSDARQQGWTALYAKSKLCETVASLAVKYGEYLTMSFVGFGNTYTDFSTLQTMAQACNDTNSGSHAEYTYCGKMAHSVGRTLTSFATSLTQTRTSLMGRGTSSGQKRTVASERETGLTDKWIFYTILNHWIYSPSSRRLVNLPTEPPGALDEENPMRANPPPYLAMNTSSCGYGAERIAFRCSLAKEPSPNKFTLGTMVAKETNLVHQMSENVAFHKAFCETQSLASYLADEFNMRIRATSTYDPFRTPIISFLPCSVLVLQDHTVPDGIRGVLVEKMLDTKRFGWCKWNDNGGGVEGQAYHAPLDLEYELNSIRQPAGAGHAALEGVMEEGDEEEDSDDYSDDDQVEMSNHVQDSRTGPTNDIAPQAYLQAFSHFTHAFTNRKVLVCDLQGVYNTSTVPPKFELTDPAIHYRSKKRRMVYGRTDKGESGIRLFFKTHKCSDLCKLVNLSKRNKDWHQAWCQHHQSKHASAVG